MDYSEEIGNLFTTTGKDAWQCVMYCGDPTATFKKLDSGETCGGGVNSPNVQKFKKLIIKD